MGRTCQIRKRQASPRRRLPAPSTALSELHKLRLDMARWVRPQEVADLSELTFAVAVTLLYRHLPLRAMAWYRFACALHHLGAPLVPGYVQRRLLRLYGLELIPGAAIGGGLYIAHPVGCTLVAESIGNNVSVISNVTFGFRNAGWPRISDDVFIGAGARVIGAITIGEGARVGANAVVLDDVDPHTSVVGVPARPTGGSTVSLSSDR